MPDVNAVPSNPPSGGQLHVAFTDQPNIGYGRMGVHIAKEVAKLGVEVLGAPRPTDARAAQSACWMAIPGHAQGWWQNQTASVLTMWEAMRLPEAFREALHNFETVIVPSEQNVELFGAYHDDVRYVPLGIDPEQWHYTDREHPGEWFNFLIGGSGPRKGIDVAIAAFRKVFGRWHPDANPKPRLILKAPRVQDIGGSDLGGRIIQMNGKLPAEEEIALYEMAHCFLQPSRGEGFGLQPLQAIAQGIPTILTDAHGHASFSHLGWGIGWKPVKAAYFIYGDAGQWWEPDLDDLCDRMKWMYDNWTEATITAAVASDVVAEQFTWKHTAEKFLACFDHLGPLENRGEWFEPSIVMFPTRVNRKTKCDIAGIHYELQPGTTYELPSDVKRVLDEAGFLDDSCREMGGIGL